MNVIIITSLVLTLLGLPTWGSTPQPMVSNGQYGRVRTSHPLHNTCRETNCCCTCEDLIYLISLVRALEDKETPVVPVNNCVTFHAEDLVEKLVNALIELTTQALTQLKFHCHTIPVTNGGNNNMNPTVPEYVGGSSYSHNGGGLLNVDLLNPNRKDNVLGVDLANQPLLGVGLGGGGGGGGNDGASQNKNCNCQYTNSGKSDEGLINLDLLNPNKEDNIADLDLAQQHVLGVSLGGTSGSTHTTPISSNNEGMTKPGTTNGTNSGTTNGTSNANNTGTKSGSNNGTNSGKGLIDLDLLNPNVPDNVAELDLSHQNVLGVGLGDQTIPHAI